MKNNFLHSHYFWFFVALSIVVGFVGWRSQNPTKQNAFDGYVYKKSEGILFISMPYLVEGQVRVPTKKRKMYDQVKVNDSICFTKNNNELEIVKLGQCHANKN